MAWGIHIIDVNLAVDKKLRFACFGSLLFVLLPLFFWGGPDWASPPFYRHVWDFGHIAFFALVGAFVQYGIGISTTRRWLLSTALVLLTGVAIEYIQLQVGRNASGADVFNNLIGFWLGVVWLAPAKPWIRWAVTALIIPSLFSIAVAALVQAHQAWQFPVLADFEGTLEQQRLRGPVFLSRKHVQQGEGSLEIRFTRRKYSGAYINVFHGDWSGYRELVMDFYNPGPSELVVTLRISDRSHDRGANDYDDRFNRRLHLQSGWNQVRIPVQEIREMPVDRAMQMNQVRTLGVYTTYLKEPRVLYWDYVRLE